MDKIIEACKDLDYSWMPKRIGNFNLHIDKSLQNKDKEYLLFHYENDLGWRWEALYDKEVEDYTVHINMPLFEFVDISFIAVEADKFWEGLQARCVQELTKMLIDPQQNFSHAYKVKGLTEWNYAEALPPVIGNFTLDIDPHHGIRMINGSYIIAEYRKKGERTGLIVFFNVLRDEFFAELRHKNHPEIDHYLDAKTIPELEAVLLKHVPHILEDLETRI